MYLPLIIRVKRLHVIVYAMIKTLSFPMRGLYLHSFMRSIRIIKVRFVRFHRCNHCRAFILMIPARFFEWSIHSFCFLPWLLLSRLLLFAAFPGNSRINNDCSDKHANKTDIFCRCLLHPEHHAKIRNHALNKQRHDDQK